MCTWIELVVPKRRNPPLWPIKIIRIASFGFSMISRVSTDHDRHEVVLDPREPPVLADRAVPQVVRGQDRASRGRPARRPPALLRLATVHRTTQRGTGR